MLRTVADQPTLWEAILPDELRRLPIELARIDVLLDDPVFFAPFIPFFDPRMGRPSTPMAEFNHVDAPGWVSGPVTATTASRYMEASILVRIRSAPILLWVDGGHSSSPRVLSRASEAVNRTLREHRRVAPSSHQGVCFSSYFALKKSRRVHRRKVALTRENGLNPLG